MLTLIVRALLIPLYRKQLVSQRRMQLLQPEIKEIQKRYKGDSMKVRVAQQELFKERGVNPLSGCLPAPPPDAPPVHHVLGHPARA